MEEDQETQTESESGPDLSMVTMEEMFNEMNSRFPGRILLVYTENHAQYSCTHVEWVGDPINGLGMAQYAVNRITSRQNDEFNCGGED
ncbi:hypothetical protein [Nitrospira sp. BLG_1]|uniref:hypothetical protein n=1 Tax=Nitrospira sp. BLG_1 TaxID=3395883 RepID=UPI0039BCCB66